MIKLHLKKELRNVKNTSNEKLESNSSPESEEKRRYGITVADYFCDRRHGDRNVIREKGIRALIKGLQLTKKPLILILMSSS